MITLDDAVDKVKRDLEDEVQVINSLDPGGKAAATMNPVLGVRESKGTGFDHHNFPIQN